MVYYNNEYDGDMSNIDWNAMWYIIIMNMMVICPILIGMPCGIL